MVFKYEGELEKAIKAALPSLLLMFAIFLIYSPSLGLPFLDSWDDPDHVTANIHLALSWENLGYWWTHKIVGIFMPLTMYSYMADHFFWGLDPLGYRLQNLFWHVFSAVMIYGCFRCFRINRWLAWSVVLIWAVHPQRVESVVWLSERKDVLCAGLYFASIFCYMRGLEAKRGRIFAYVLFVLALLAKPMAVSLPFVIVLIEFWRRRDRRPKYYLKTLIIWLIPAIFLMALTAYLQFWSKGKEFFLLRQAAVVVHNVSWYGIAAFVPYDLSPIYPRIDFSAGVVVMIVLFWGALLGGGVWSYRYLPRETFIYKLLPLIAAWLVSMGPIIGVFQVGFIDRADRYNYIPSVFLWFGLCMLLEAGLRRRIIAGGRVALLLLSFLVYLAWLIFVNINYLNSWKDFSNLIRVTCDRPHPNNIAIIELGLFEIQERNSAGLFHVAAMFRDNKQEWMSENDKTGHDIMAAYFEGYAYYFLGQKGEAVRCFEFMAPRIDHRSLAKRGIFDDVIVKLFVYYDSKHDRKRTDFYLNRLLDSYRDREKGFQYYFFSGLKAIRNNQKEAARDFFREAARLRPGDENTQRNLTIIETELGRK